MFLNVSGLLKGNADVIPFEIVESREIISRDDYTFILKSPLKITGEAFYDGGLIKIRGTVMVKVEALCSRCLQNFDYEININFDESFSKSHDNEDIYYFDNNTINLYNMIIDNMILSMPIKILCSENCKGLCHQCGKNLNTGECNCTKGETDPRFEVLKDLFKGD